MDIASLVYGINNMNLDGMLPISKVNTLADIDHYNENGYQIGYTLAGWKDKFPDIKADNVYYLKDNVRDKTVYYDKKKYIWFPLPIYGTEELFLSDNGNADLLNSISRLETYYEHKRFDQLIFFTDGPARIKILNDILTNEPVEDYFYTVFVESYQSVDYGASLISVDNLRRLDYMKPASLANETLKKLDKYTKEDTITIYRGVGDKSTPLEQAVSWTTDINQAYFFALRLAKEGCKIYTTTVRKKDVLEYIDDFIEKEIIILPDYVENVKTLVLPTFESITSDMYANTDYFDLYLSKVKEIKELYKDQGSQHGYKHVLRVLFNALYICYKEEVPINHVHTLVKAIMWHDVGRINDKEDVMHGERSYRYYVNRGNQANKLLQFLMKYHCVTDEISLNYLHKYAGTRADKEIYTKLYNILKDADALDRLRFGIRHLDVKYLRTETAKTLPLFSNVLVDAYLGEDEAI